MSHVVVLVSVGTPEEAAQIGRTLVTERLAACANVVPFMSSTYWWRGQIEQVNETLLIVKTRQDLVDALTSRVKALHSYSVPEVVAIAVVGGNRDYLAWIDESVRG